MSKNIDDLRPSGKVTVQQKIAELESRIVALEKAQKTVTRTVTTTVQDGAVDLEPEMGRMWASFDALFAKVFKR
jgi:hypothetical protein